MELGQLPLELRTVQFSFVFKVQFSFVFKVLSYIGFQKPRCNASALSQTSSENDLELSDNSDN